jgi:hypothetical protein
MGMQRLRSSGETRCMHAYTPMQPHAKRAPALPTGPSAARRVLCRPCRRHMQRAAHRPGPCLPLAAPRRSPACSQAAARDRRTPCKGRGLCRSRSRTRRGAGRTRRARSSTGASTRCAAAPRRAPSVPRAAAAAVPATAALVLTTFRQLTPTATRSITHSRRLARQRVVVAAASTQQQRQQQQLRPPRRTKRAGRRTAQRSSSVAPQRSHLPR